MTQTILGIDPGTQITAYAVITPSNIRNKFRVISYGEIKTGKRDYAEKLAHIFIELEKIIAFHKPDALSLEAAFYGKNPQSLVKLGRVQGIVLALAMLHKLEKKMFAPREIKKAVTGYGNASKEQVALTLPHWIENFPKEKLSSDQTDAFAIALTYWIYQ